MSKNRLNLNLKKMTNKEKIKVIKVESTNEKIKNILKESLSKINWFLAPVFILCFLFLWMFSPMRLEGGERDVFIFVYGLGWGVFASISITYLVLDNKIKNYKEKK